MGKKENSNFCLRAGLKEGGKELWRYLRKGSWDLEQK